LYILYLDIDRPVCLAAQGGSLAWRWHARYEHLNFHALRKLADIAMVNGLPEIDHVDQVCDGYLVGKQKRATFPSVVKYRATEKLELVHGNLCSPVTPGGKRYFFLLVDDISRYMWLVLLTTKDEALQAFVVSRHELKPKPRRRLGHFALTAAGSSQHEVLSNTTPDVACNDI
jgi:hypothetical protein